ncbi:MAG: endolytic transglycosylase MltG [Solirubrobacteraceae bacterium]
MARASRGGSLALCRTRVERVGCGQANAARASRRRDERTQRRPRAAPRRERQRQSATGGATSPPRGVVSSSFFFSLRARLDGDGPKLRHGVVTLRHGMSYAAALSVLTTAPALTQLEVSIPEGYTRRQIAVVASTDGLRGSYLIASRPANAGLDPRRYGAPASVHTLEGFLFPATYFSFAHENVAHLVAQQIAAFHQNFDSLDFARARAAGLTRYDVLIIASMVEREAQVPSDRPLVAAVIYNRLHDGMTLGIDATLRYYLGDYDHPLTASQLALNTPYNTRLHAGLPPTPISNPGLASMIAATHPAAVGYLYYVDAPNTCGKLAFATTYAQFEVDAAAYNAARNAAGGRAPTKCP